MAMNLFGIGIDIVEIERIGSSIHEFKDKFLNRIFTRAEQEYCEAHKRPEIHYAARFAAKEAVAKAFGTGIGKEISWLDIEIMKQSSGQPFVNLSGNGKNFAEKIKVVDIKLSLTHAECYAAANVVIMVENTPVH